MNSTESLSSLKTTRFISLEVIVNIQGAARPARPGAQLAVELRVCSFNRDSEGKRLNVLTSHYC